MNKKQQLAALTEIQERIEQIEQMSYYFKSKHRDLKSARMIAGDIWIDHAKSVIADHEAYLTILRLQFSTTLRALYEFDLLELQPPGNVPEVGKQYLVPTVYPATVIGIHNPDYLG